VRDNGLTFGLKRQMFPVNCCSPIMILSLATPISVKADAKVSYCKAIPVKMVNGKTEFPMKRFVLLSTRCAQRQKFDHHGQTRNTAKLPLADQPGLSSHRLWVIQREPLFDARPLCRFLTGTT